MIRSLILMASFALFGCLQLSAQSCKELYQGGNTFVEQGKLKKAKAKFLQVIKCGNNLYVPDSEKRIVWINRILRKSNTVRPFSLLDNGLLLGQKNEYMSFVSFSLTDNTPKVYALSVYLTNENDWLEMLDSLNFRYFWNEKECDTTNNLFAFTNRNSLEESYIGLHLMLKKDILHMSI